MRIGILSGAILIALGVLVGSPLYVGIKILALTEWYPLSFIGAFLVFWGAVYFGRAILKGSDKINKVLEHFVA